MSGLWRGITGLSTLTALKLGTGLLLGSGLMADPGGTTPVGAFNVLSSNGTSYSPTNVVLDSDGTSYTVSVIVLSSNSGTYVPVSNYAYLSLFNGNYIQLEDGSGDILLG